MPTSTGFRGADTDTQSWAFFKGGDSIRCFCNRRILDLGAEHPTVAVRPSTGRTPLPGVMTHKCKRCDMVLEIRISTGKAAA